MAIVTRDTTPQDLLGRFRGRVVSSRMAYPEVLQLHVEDENGDLWGLVTFEAEFSPPEPEALLDKIVSDTYLDIRSGKLTVTFVDGSSLQVVPLALAPEEVDDDYESWQLFTPDGLVLNYGPEEHWLLKKASDPV